MPSVRTAILHNTGQNHAYYQVCQHTRVFAQILTHQRTKIASLSFLSVSACLRQVLDVCPLLGMMVSPPEGVVPSGGQAALTIHFHPESVMKFDTRIEVRESRKDDLFLCVCVRNQERNECTLSMCVYYR